MLLEPDPTTPAYHICQVTLNGTTGAISWVRVVLRHIPAAGLGGGMPASGRVVAINTDHGRIGCL